MAQDIERAIELEPNHPDRKLDLAGVHLQGLIYACPELYDAQFALEAARQNFELEPNSEAVRRLLGIALYRNGEYAEAIEHQQAAMAAYAGEATDPFYLAMQHWKLGQRREARDYYDRAVAWMETTGSKSPELERLKKEASELMGL